MGPIVDQNPNFWWFWNHKNHAGPGRPYDQYDQSRWCRSWSPRTPPEWGWDGGCFGGYPYYTRKPPYWKIMYITFTPFLYMGMSKKRYKSKVIQHRMVDFEGLKIKMCLWHVPFLEPFRWFGHSQNYVVWLWFQKKHCGDWKSVYENYNLAKPAWRKPSVRGIQQTTNSNLKFQKVQQMCLSQLSHSRNISSTSHGQCRHAVGSKIYGNMGAQRSKYIKNDGPVTYRCTLLGSKNLIFWGTPILTHKTEAKSPWFSNSDTAELKRGVWTKAANRRTSIRQIQNHHLPHKQNNDFSKLCKNI